MGLPRMVELPPGRWIHLPGTAVEVYLREPDGAAECVHRRDDYWDLTDVYSRLYVRGVDVGSHPATYHEAVRPRTRSLPRRRSI